MRKVKFESEIVRRWGRWPEEIIDQISTFLGTEWFFECDGADLGCLEWKFKLPEKIIIKVSLMPQNLGQLAVSTQISISSSYINEFYSKASMWKCFSPELNSSSMIRPQLVCSFRPEWLFWNENPSPSMPQVYCKLDDSTQFMEIWTRNFRDYGLRELAKFTDAVSLATYVSNLKNYKRIVGGNGPTASGGIHVAILYFQTGQIDKALECLETYRESITHFIIKSKNRLSVEKNLAETECICNKAKCYMLNNHAM